MKVLFLPEYGAAVGGGHVMRCLTLAGELSRRGAECAFAVAPEARPVMAAFAPGTAIVDDSWPADVVVLDGYGYTADHERAFAAEGLKVAAFDDILRAHDCDLIIDSGLGRAAADYPGRARVLAGAEYSPVRPEFAALREDTLARRDGTGGRLLISLGLTDVGGITARVLDLVSGEPGWSAIDIVLGAGAPSLTPARFCAVADRRTTLHVDTRDMARLTAAADFAVGAGGSSQWERSVLGLPTLLLVLAENQAATAARLEALGAALVLDVNQPGFEAGFKAAFQRLARDPALRRSIGANAAAIFDGKGAARVADAVLELIP